MLNCEELNKRVRHESHGGIWDTDYEDQKAVRVPNPTDPKEPCPKYVYFKEGFGFGSFKMNILNS